MTRSTTLVWGMTRPLTGWVAHGDEDEPPRFANLRSCFGECASDRSKDFHDKSAPRQHPPQDFNLQPEPECDMNHHNQQHDRPTMKDSVNALYYFSCCLTQCYSVFNRRDFGRDAFGLPTIVAGGIILAYGSMMRCPEMWPYFGCWLLALIAQRLKQFQNWRSGIVQHSLYQGYPALAFKFFPRMKSEVNAKGVEAFLCLGVGGLLTVVSAPLGWFVMLGFPAILFSEAVQVDVTRRRLQARRDAEIEQAYFEDRYKSGRF